MKNLTEINERMDELNDLIIDTKHEFDYLNRELHDVGYRLSVYEDEFESLEIEYASISKTSPSKNDDITVSITPIEHIKPKEEPLSTNKDIDEEEFLPY